MNKTVREPYTFLFLLDLFRRVVREDRAIREHLEARGRLRIGDKWS
jgi:hypothetical protein